MGKYITYLFTLFFINIIKITPFALVYAFSDVVYFFLFHITGYRKAVVIANLKKSFPEKSEKEIKSITKRFYKNLSDITVESLKGITMSEKQVLKRYKVKNPEVADKYFDKGINIMNLASHYCNWEWGILAVDLQVKHKCHAIYKPMSNKYVEEYMKKKREKHGMKLVPIDKTKETFTAKHEKPISFIMAADQSPSSIKKAIYVDFLNRKTACIHGPEAYAKKMNMPMVYFDVQRVKRGHYSMKIIDLIDDPSKYKEGEITEKYMKTLEKIILNKPENWLWSHKRWKHNKN